MSMEIKGKKRLFAGVLFIVALMTAATALAGRMYAVEIGYFDASGHMNGSITYPCMGGKWIEGELVGTPHEIWSEECFGGKDGW